jgi:cell wall-associated NlpC family hydrolase
MPLRLVISVFSCALAAALAGGPAAAQDEPPVLPGVVESPARFVPPPPPPAPPTLAERAVKLARAQLGVPYVWGGSSPAGFDCSGLVSWVYGRLGISLPHNAAALYDVGRPVPLSEMRPGDLVFFSGLGHVGLYVGNGRMIHAPQSGRNVEIEALDARSYPPVGARRVTRL